MCIYKPHILAYATETGFLWLKEQVHLNLKIKYQLFKFQHRPMDEITFALVESRWTISPTGSAFIRRQHFLLSAFSWTVETFLDVDVNPLSASYLLFYGDVTDKNHPKSIHFRCRLPTFNKVKAVGEEHSCVFLIPYTFTFSLQHHHVRLRGGALHPHHPGRHEGQEAVLHSCSSSHWRYNTCTVLKYSEIIYC